jgi:hypothetical protein
VEVFQEYIDEVRAVHGESAGIAANEGLRGIEQLGLRVRRQTPVPTKGLAIGVIEPSIDSWNATLMVGHGRTGDIGWELLRLRKHNPFRIEEREAELRSMLEKLPGYVERPDYPAVTWFGLAEGDGLSAFLAAVSWTAERVRKSNPAG